MVSTERLAEGTETLYFYFNYSYIGRGINARISNVAISRACSTKELVDPRFNLSCQLLQSGIAARPLNPPDNTLTYSAVPLSRLPNMDRFLENDWKSFLKALNRELTFPIKVRITYQHDTNNDGVQETETQTACEQVSYFVDDTLIDPRKVLPDWLLHNFVDYLQDAIKALTKVQEQIDKVIDYVAVGCLYSFFAHLIVKIYRTWVDLSSETLLNPVLKKFLLGKESIASLDPECKEIHEAIEGFYKQGNVKLKHYSDLELKKCFTSSYKAWQTEAKMYQLQRWSCDRLFGHSSPSKWTETESDDALLRKIESKAACNADESVRGTPLNAKRCRDIQLSKYRERPENFELEDICFESTDGNKETLWTLGEPVDSATKLYRINYAAGDRTAVFSYAIKRSENLYLTAQPKSCEELCGIKTKISQTIVEFGNERIVLNKDPKDKTGSEKGVACTTVDNCISWNVNKAIVSGDGKKREIQSAYRVGFSNRISDYNPSPCFYDTGKSTAVISDNRATREECCCINTKEGVAPPSLSYQPDDISIATGKPIHESKAIADKILGKDEFSDMKWSYRYSRIKYEAKGIDGYAHNSYNLNRYIEGRDLPACFGQDSQFHKLFGKEEEVLTLNPFKQQTAALQCAYLTGINQRLQLYKNIMSAMSNCLVEIRKDGRADAGVCKELFTQHVCGLMWQLVKFFIDGCAVDDTPIEDVGGRDEKIGEKISRGLKGISQGISEAQQEITDEYQNVKLENLLGTGKDSVARKACLAAFGYDWQLNARNLIDAAYTTPFATLVQAVTRSREFLTVDPFSFKPKYEYRVSWVINPGCELENYIIDLVCVTSQEMDNYPNQINCGAVGAPSIASTGAIGTSTG